MASDGGISLKRQPSGESTSSTKKQRSIAQSFSCSEQKRPRDSPPSSQFSPNQKRPRLEAPTNETSARPSTMSTSTDNMYNFGATNGKTLIDLTKSPSPRSRHVSGAPAKVDNTCMNQFGAKKLFVKNLRTTARSDPSNYCNATISKLDGALTAIFQGQRPKLSNEELYKGCENVCRLGKAEDLARKLLQRMKDHVARDIREDLAHKSSGRNVEVLKAITAAWTMWKHQFVCLTLHSKGLKADSNRKPFS